MKKQLSLSAAVLFIINIIIGSGVFINTIPLIQASGKLSWLVYFFTAIIISPLVITCFLLAQSFPGKNLYEIYSTFNESLGFVGTWCYVFSKLATSAIGLIVGSSMICALWGNSSITFLSLGILFFFSLSNFKQYGITFLMQCTITVCKMFPLFTIVSIMIYKLFYTQPVLYHCVHDYNNYSFINIFSSIPLVIFSFSGFESLFGIASRVVNPSKNSSRAVLIGFISVIIAYCFYQYGSASLLCEYIQKIEKSSLHGLFMSISKLLNLPLYIGKLFCVSIAISAFGVSYGILFSNTRNIINTIDKKHDYIWYIILPLIISLYIVYFHNNIIILQQLSAFGTLITYTIFSIIYNLNNKYKTISSYIFSLLSFVVIVIFFYVTYINATTKGFLGYKIFLILLLISFLCLKIKKKLLK
jgi:hypothetical protein